MYACILKYSSRYYLILSSIETLGMQHNSVFPQRLPVFVLSYSILSLLIKYLRVNFSSVILCQRKLNPVQLRNMCLYFNNPD